VILLAGPVPVQVVSTVSILSTKGNDMNGTAATRETRYAPIPLALHAKIDVAVLSFVLVSPWVFGFTQHRGATIMAVCAFFGGMALNLVTDYPAGLVKLIPMKLHKLAEITSPPITLIVPWVFFADAGAFPWVMTIAGLAVIANAMLTRQVAA
jgi:thiamine transporter ThiT